MSWTWVHHKKHISKLTKGIERVLIEKNQEK